MFQCYLCSRAFQVFDYIFDITYSGNADVSAHRGGRTIVVIGDAQTAVNLLENQSVNYGDRPVLKLVRAFPFAIA